MIKISKIALLLLQSTLLVAVINYGFTASHHEDKFTVALPYYVLAAVVLVASFAFGVVAIKQPQHKIANWSFLAISLIPNLFLGWALVKCIQNYSSYPAQLLPIMAIIVVVMITFLVNVVLMAINKS